jgi:acyl-CoA synthetase (AMP-forming)/AMP-acid ligase II
VTLLELLDQQATRFGAKSVFRFLDTGVDWSFAELAARAARAGGQLRMFEPGERLGVLTDDRAAFCDAFFAAHARGLTPVPLGAGGVAGSPTWSHVLADRVRRFGLAGVATDPGLAGAVRAALDHAVTVVTLDGAAGEPVAFGPSAPHAFVQPSSGTTGDPKGVVVGERALLANLAAIGEHWDLGPDDIGLSWLPLHHDMGLIGTMINALYLGGTLYHWPTTSFLRSPGRFLQLVDELAVTLTVAPPFALALISKRQQRRPVGLDLTRVRSLLVGAETIRPDVLDTFSRTFRPHGLAASALSPTYGLAEATLAVTANPVDAPYRVVEVDGRPATSCGGPLPGVEVALGVHDELLVSSPAVMDGYLDDREATAAALVDGWLRTGDTAALVDGDVVITGRSKEMINRGGVRVSAVDFELALADVEGLLADRVVAFADTEPNAAGNGTGERVVVLAESRWTDRAGEAVLAARARLSQAGLPVDVVEIVRPGFIPRTTSGKLRRGAAREKWQAARRVGSD